MNVTGQKLLEEPVGDPDRHLKRLQKVFGVSGRIQNLAIRRHKSPTRINKEAEQKAILAKSTDIRKARLNEIGQVHRFILESVANVFKIDTDRAIDGIADADRYIGLMKEFVQKRGRFAIVFFYDWFPYPGIGKPDRRKNLYGFTFIYFLSRQNLADMLVRRNTKN